MVYQTKNQTQSEIGFQKKYTSLYYDEVTKVLTYIMSGEEGK
jgi:hypothetical protein